MKQSDRDKQIDRQTDKQTARQANVMLVSVSVRNGRLCVSIGQRSRVAGGACIIGDSVTSLSIFITSCISSSSIIDSTSASAQTLQSVGAECY